MSQSDNLNIRDIFDFYERRGYRNAVGPGERPAVLVIDFSNAFTGGRTEFPGGDFAEEVRQTRRLLDAARTKSISIFFTTIAYTDPHQDPGLWGVKVPWLVHCKAETKAVAIDSSLDVKSNELVIEKKYPSAFFGTDLEQHLLKNNIDTVVLAGCTTSVCVRATAIDAMQRGFRTIIAAEAVGDFDRSLHAVHLRDLDARYADVMPVDDVVEYIGCLPDAGA
jgi:nicotinamidase-related amidase